MFNNYEKNSFIVIGDIHGTIDAIRLIKRKYLKNYDKIFILGDAIDRGEDSLDTLLAIMDLCERYPNRVKYLPGNHDWLLYEYMLNGDKEVLTHLESNGGLKTVKEVNELKKVNPTYYEDIVNWLSRQPIQVKHEYKGKKYAFAHAFFNDKLYNYKKNASFYDYTKGNNALRAAIQNTIWYRKPNPYNKDEVVTEDHEVVIGHTPLSLREGIDLDLINKNNKKVKVHCIDGGMVFKNKMLYFDGESVKEEKDIRYKEDTNQEQKQQVNEQKQPVKERVKSTEKVKATKKPTTRSKSKLFNILVVATLRKASTLEASTEQISKMIQTGDYSYIKDLKSYQEIQDNLSKDDIVNVLTSYYAKRESTNTLEKDFKKLLTDYTSEVILESVYNVSAVLNPKAPVEQVIEAFKQKDYTYITNKNGQFRELAIKVGFNNMLKVAKYNGYKSLESYLRKDLEPKYKVKK